MKKNTGNRIGLGIFVSVALVLFVVAIYFIGERQQLFKNTFEVNAVFKNVEGLQVGNNVRFSGINIGIVNNITQISDTSVKVELQIDKSTQKFIKRDATASIGSDGLMGNKIIIIAPGTGTEAVIQNNSYIRSIAPIDMDEVFASLKTTSDNAASITTDLASIAKNIRNGKGTIGMLFTDTVFAHNLGGAIVNIKQGAKGFKQNMDAAGNSFLLKRLVKKEKNKEEKGK